jgi:parvulin-like peptidyl-prolyl isomerase
MATPVLQVGGRTIMDADLIPLLIRYQLLPQLYRELLIDQAIAEIECDPEETEQALQQFYETHQIVEATARHAWCTRTGTTAHDLETLATRTLRIETFKRRRWGHKLEAHFLTCKAEFDQVIYSLLRTPHPEVAQELYFRIRAGEQSFADLASQYSQGPEAETGGVLGPVPLTQPHPALAEKLANSQPGHLFPPTRIGEWYIVFRLEKLIPAQLNETMRKQLLNQFFEDWLQEKLSPSP